MAVLPSDVVSGLVAALDEAAGCDPGVLGDGDTLQVLFGQLRRLEALVTRAVGAFDAGGTWEPDGARSAAAWVSTRCHLALGQSRRHVANARALRHMAVTEAAWVAGDIGSAHVQSLVAARCREVDCFARDEALLVTNATNLGFGQFTRTLGYWTQCADPDGVEVDAARQYSNRGLHLSRSIDGGWFLDGVFDPLGGTVIAEALRVIEDELFQADWAAAKKTLGENVSVGDLSRTPAQRRADALGEMAARAMATPPGCRLPEPLLSVYVGYETFAGRICELADGTVVAPGSLLGHLDAAWVERVVFEGPDRVKNVGVARRLFSGATRRAVQLRDRRCFSPFCEVVATHAEIDHIEAFAAGGLTTDDNGRVACDYHNRLRQRNT